MIDALNSIIVDVLLANGCFNVVCYPWHHKTLLLAARRIAADIRYSRSREPETHLLTAHMLQPRRLASRIFVLCKENRLPVCAALLLLSPGPSYNTAQNIGT